MKMNHRYNISKLLESLKKSECTHLQTNHYLFDYYDDVLKDIGSVFDVDFSKRVRSIGEIKKF